LCLHSQAWQLLRPPPSGHPRKGSCLPHLSRWLSTAARASPNFVRRPHLHRQQGHRSSNSSNNSSNNNNSNNNNNNSSNNSSSSSCSPPASVLEIQSWAARRAAAECPPSGLAQPPAALSPGLRLRRSRCSGSSSSSRSSSSSSSSSSSRSSCCQPSRQAVRRNNSSNISSNINSNLSGIVALQFVAPLHRTLAQWSSNKLSWLGPPSEPPVPRLSSSSTTTTTTSSSTR